MSDFKDLMRDLDGVKLDTDLAAAAFERRRQAELFRSDGTPRYTPEEMRERDAALLKPLEARVDEALALVEKARAVADAYTEEATHTDPASILTDAELARARAAAEFTREDLAAMDLAALAGRVNTASRGTDRASAWLVARYGSKRLVELRKEATAKPPQTEGETRRLQGLMAQLDQVDASLKDLAASLTDPKRAAQGAQAGPLRDKARAIEQAARAAWGTATGEAERLKDAKRRSGEYSL